MGKWLTRLMLTGGLALLGASLWYDEALPEPARLRAELLEEPVQKQVNRPTLHTTVKGVTYSVKPLYSYELTGLVVSRHDTGTFWDHIHRDWNDNLNIADLCVVWGDNVSTGAYLPVEFSSGQFTCNLRMKTQQDYEAFNLAQISNNHLLADNPRLAKRVLQARVGDQVRFTGYLAEYSHNHGFPFTRGTSTVRTDTGDGACETVYLEDFEILKQGGGPWRKLYWLALVMLGCGVLLWMFLPPTLDSMGD